MPVQSNTLGTIAENQRMTSPWVTLLRAVPRNIELIGVFNRVANQASVAPDRESRKTRVSFADVPQRVSYANAVKISAETSNRTAPKLRGLTSLSQKNTRPTPTMAAAGSSTSRSYSTDKLMETDVDDGFIRGAYYTSEARNLSHSKSSSDDDHPDAASQPSKS